MVKRRPHVPRLFWPNYEANSVDCREDYYRRLCMLFKPWRNETSLMGKNFNIIILNLLIQN